MLWLLSQCAKAANHCHVRTFTSSPSSSLRAQDPSTSAAAAEVLVHSCLEFAAKRSELAAVTIKVQCSVSTPRYGNPAEICRHSNHSRLISSIAAVGFCTLRGHFSSTVRGVAIMRLCNDCFSTFYKLRLECGSPSSAAQQRSPATSSTDLPK